MKVYIYTSLFILIYHSYCLQNIKSDRYFLSKSSLLSYLLILRHDGTGELYDWGGSFRNKLNINWENEDDKIILFFLVNFKGSDTPISDTLHISGKYLKKTKILKEIESEHEIQFLSDEIQFKALTEKKFKKKYYEFLNRGF